MSTQNPSQDPNAPLFHTPNPSELQSEESKATTLKKLSEQSPPDRGGESDVIDSPNQEVSLVQDDDTLPAPMKTLTPPD